MLLTEKKLENIKVCMVANVHKKQQQVSKRQNTLSTVYLKLTMIITITCAHKNRDVKIIDMLGSFFSLYTDRKMIHVLQKRIVHLLVEFSQGLTHEDYIHIDLKGRKMYLKLNKPLHRTLRIVLMLWKNMCTQLINLGYKLKPYDPCMVNKMLDRKKRKIL